MNLSRNFLKILGINLILIFAVLGVLTTGPFIVYQTYHLFKPQSHLPIAVYGEKYSWCEEHLNDWAKLSREYKDYVVWKSKPLSGPTINIDQNGVRLTKPCEAIEHKNRRYLFFGSSQMLGLGAPDALTIPSIFAELNRAETANYAGLGWDTRQCLSYLVNLYIENKIKDKKKYHYLR